MPFSSLKQIIETEMRLKTTEELVDIWISNNRAEWTDEAFEVIREILTERLDLIPVQNNSTYERVDLFNQDIKNFLNSTGFISIGMPFVFPLLILFMGYKILQLFYGTKIPEAPMSLILSIALVLPIVSGIIIIKRREIHNGARVIKGWAAVLNGFVLVIGFGIVEIYVWYFLIKSLINF